MELLERPKQIPVNQVCVKLVLALVRKLDRKLVNSLSRKSFLWNTQNLEIELNLKHLEKNIITDG